MAECPVRLKVPKPRGCQSLIAFDRGSHVELSLLVVREDVRNRGVGTEAVERVKAAARNLDKAITLQVDWPKWRRLVRFYQRLGFQREGSRSMVWRPESEVAA